MKIEVLNVNGSTVKLVVELNGEKHHATAKVDTKHKLLNIGIDNDIVITAEDLSEDDLNQYNDKIKEFVNKQ
jgi:hypothetical protein